MLHGLLSSLRKMLIYDFFGEIFMKGGCRRKKQPIRICGSFSLALHERNFVCIGHFELCYL